MTAAIVIGLVLLLAAGLTLLLLGLRGRRINDHPICRGCGFDLVGVLPAGSTCPECGAGIKSSRWVRIGARRKRVTWILAGVVVTLGAAVPLGTGVIALASGANIVRHKPLGLLLWEARRGSDETRGIIGAELERRMLGGLVSAEQSELAAELALDIQGDVERRWDPVWARVFDQARLAGAATPTQIERFGVQSIVPGLLVRPVVRAGDPLPFEIVVKEYRGIEPVPQNSWFRTQVVAVELAGKPLSSGGTALGGGVRRDSTLAAPRLNSRMSRSSGAPALVGTDVPTGRQPFVVTVKVERSVFAAPAQPRSSAAAERMMTLAGEVDVRPQGTTVVDEVELSDEMARELTDLIRARGIVQRDAGSGDAWSPTIDFVFPLEESEPASPGGPEVPAVHADIMVIQADGTERALGELRNESIVQTLETRAAPLWFHTPGMTMHATPIQGPTVRLRLTLDPEKASRFIRMGAAVRGELVITDVPVSFQTNRGIRADTLEEFRRLNAKPEGQ